MASQFQVKSPGPNIFQAYRGSDVSVVPDHQSRGLHIRPFACSLGATECYTRPDYSTDPADPHPIYIAYEAGGDILPRRILHPAIHTYSNQKASCSGLQDADADEITLNHLHAHSW